ncbi:GTP 3',8-cyclase MoaA [Kordiimonas aestuarii]|uniref:GTP 3',8-cyclase MoaA n=1 Tax=Kordiimonas aestuarii TaxID=1005925 RepID=UPI0021D13B10|nr:GTP 3',8-cyclase MoaA [Kordiimonas aestuarii]
MPDDVSHIPASTPLQDSFGRRITYLRLSVTDRCDLRCRYCMAEHMTFLPKPEVLTLEEMLSLSRAFMERGVRRIRLTGGEPLVRKNILWLIEALGDEVKRSNLDEITITTNGTQLAHMSHTLAQFGLKRINVSLDTLQADKFAEITRRDRLTDVMNGILTARDAGLKVKINTVALKGKNEDELIDILDWCVSEGLDLTLIETMPLGDVADAREDNYLPLTAVLPRLGERWALTPSGHRTGGPARYYDIAETGRKLGLITPLTGNFCDGCNRVRVTCTGRIYMCLGQDDHVDLRAALRSDNPQANLHAALDKAIGAKPKGHDFAMSDGRMVGKVGRHMSHTGG